jgi:hypothetical protein
MIIIIIAGSIPGGIPDGIPGAYNYSPQMVSQVHIIIIPSSNLGLPQAVYNYFPRSHSR